MKINTIGFFLLTTSVILFGVYPLIPERYESYVPVLFIVGSLLVFLTHAPKQPKHKKALLISTVLFLIFLISAVFSEDHQRALKKIETMASLIGLPIACIWFLQNIKINFERVQDRLMKIFFVSNVIYALIALYLLNFYRNPKFSEKDADFFRNALNDLPHIGDHSIYVSLFLSIAILCGLYLFFKQRKTIYKVALALGQLILLLILAMLMSKSIIIALLISTLLVFVIKQKVSKKVMLGGFLLLVIGLIILPKQNNRFVELLNTESFETLDLNNSTSVRYHILKCSFNTILNKPILGYGVGDVQNELDICYSLNNLPLPKGGYNSHNQYLFVWLSSGVLGLFVFIYYLVFVFRIGINNKDHFLINILLLFSFAFLFENVLSRQSGVIPFSFLINLLILKNIQQKDTIDSSE